MDAVQKKPLYRNYRKSVDNSKKFLFSVYTVPRGHPWQNLILEI